MVERWSSKPYAWVRFLLSLKSIFILLNQNVKKPNKLRNKLRKTTRSIKWVLEQQNNIKKLLLTKKKLARVHFKTLALSPNIFHN